MRKLKRGLNLCRTNIIVHHWFFYSKKFIKKYESFDRVFYGGYLGSVNIYEETCLYVNIRSMQLLENQAILYAGAGITRDSDPVKEWEETNLKCQILMKLLRS